MPEHAEPLTWRDRTLIVFLASKRLRAGLRQLAARWAGGKRH